MSYSFNPKIPYYYQIRQDLQDRIERGELQTGDQLPNELKLAEMYGVSRPTVRQAMRELVQDGLIVRRKGKGTFVRLPLITDSADTFTVFAEFNIPAAHWTEIIRSRRLRPPTEIREELQMSHGDEIYEIVTRRRSKAESLAIRTFYIPTALAPGLVEVIRERPFAVVMQEEFGLIAASAVQKFQALPVGDADAKLLGIKSGDPAIVWQGVLFTSEEVPMARVRTVFRGDRFAFLIRQGRSVTSDTTPDALRADYLDLGKSQLW